MNTPNANSPTGVSGLVAGSNMAGYQEIRLVQFSLGSRGCAERLWAFANQYSS